MLEDASEFLIVGQFGQTNAFPCEVGVLVLGSHGERSRLVAVRDGRTTSRAQHEFLRAPNLIHVFH
jgi:hypothetical protein